MLGFIGPKVMSRKQKKNLAENGPRIVGADSKGFWPQVGRPGPAVPVALGRGGAPAHRRHRPAVLLAPIGLGRPGDRPRRHADAGGVRHAVQGFRAGLQRAAHAGRRRATRSALDHRHGRAGCLAAARRCPRCRARLHPEQDRQRRRRPGQRLSRLGPPGRGHDRPGEPSAQRDDPPGRGSIRASTLLVGGSTAIYIDFSNVLSCQAAALHRVGGAVCPSCSS